MQSHGPVVDEIFIIMRPVPNCCYATIYIFSKYRRFYLYFKPVAFKTGLYKEIFMGISMV